MTRRIVRQIVIGVFELTCATAAVAQDEDDAVLKPAEPDFTLVSLPTSLRLPKFKSAFRVTHRFGRPLGDGDFADLVCRALSSLGLEVEAVPEAGGALDKVVERCPEIVFLDVDMPRMDGITTCERLRAAPQTSSSTIVMLTASTDDRVEQRAGEAGADLFLTKPFSPLDLLRLVDELG